MRVLQLITRSELGGAQRWVAEIARRQRQCGFEVELATGTRGWLSDQDCFADVHDFPDLVREIAPNRDSAALVGLLRFFRGRKYDVVHTHCNKAALLGRIAAAISGVPLIAHTSHGTILAESVSPGRHAMYWAAEQLGALVTHRMFAISEWESEILRRSVRMRSGALRLLTIVPDYIRTSHAAWTLREESRWDLVALGNLYFNKGYDILLPAIRSLASRYPKLRLTIYGEGPERSALEAHIARLDLCGRVRLYGRVSDVARRIEEGGIFVLPSRKEGLPLALLEAMAAGAPIVATDVGAVREVLGPTATLSRPTVPGDLMRNLDELLSSDDRRWAVACAGRAAYERLLARDDPSATATMYA